MHATREQVNHERMFAFASPNQYVFKLVRVKVKQENRGPPLCIWGDTSDDSVGAEKSKGKKKNQGSTFNISTQCECSSFFLFFQQKFMGEESDFKHFAQTL